MVVSPVSVIIVVMFYLWLIIDFLAKVNDPLLSYMSQQGQMYIWSRLV